MGADPTRRAYASPLRAAQAEQTRGSVLSAATQLFEELGWNGTGMRQIAQAAGVSVETIYAGFGSKSELFRQALDVAVVGDDEPIPLADRAEFQRLTEGSPVERAEAAVDVLLAVRLRTASLRRVLSEAASGNADLRAMMAATLTSERESVRQGAFAVAQRSVSDEDVDGLFALLSTEVFLLLTDVRGWDLATYRSWAVRGVCTALNPEGATTR